jgi:hypothetical protein
LPALQKIISPDLFPNSSPPFNMLGSNALAGIVPAAREV